MSEAPGYRVHRPGIYRRRLRIRSAAGIARADLKDDPHRYGVEIEHDGSRVTGIRGLPIRTPWTLCSAAEAMLQRLIGMPLSADATAIFRHTAAGDQCTHMFDTAGLAIAQAARGPGHRQYDIAAPYWSANGPRTLELRRDGAVILEWTVDGGQIVGPAPFAGLGWQKMLGWARDTHAGDADLLEAIVVLRRAVMISHGRTVSLDPLRVAADTGHVGGACYVFQPDVAGRAQRIHGSTLDFTDRPDALLADLGPA